jgi:hypothetical protein
MSSLLEKLTPKPKGWVPIFMMPTTMKNKTPPKDLELPPYITPSPSPPKSKSPPKDLELPPYISPSPSPPKSKSPPQPTIPKESIELPEEMNLEISNSEMKEQLEILEKDMAYKKNILVLNLDQALMIFKNFSILLKIKINDYDVHIQRLGDHLTTKQGPNNLKFSSPAFYFDKNIDQLKIKFDNSSLDHIFDMKLSPTYLIYIQYFLKSAFTTSSKLFFTLSYKNNVNTFKLNECSSFAERSSFGRYFYNLFFKQTFGNIANFLLMIDFDDLISKIKSEDDWIKKNYDNPAYSNDKNIVKYEMIKKYSYNCNLYYLELIEKYIENYELNEALTYNDDTKELHISNSFYIKLGQVMDNGFNYIIIPLVLLSTSKKNEPEAHMNLLFVDKKQKKIEKYEPHGFKKLYGDMDKHISDLFPGYDLISNVCIKGIQFLEWYIPENYTGRCVSFTYGYLFYRLKDILDGNVDPNYATEIAATKYLNYAYQQKLLFFKEINNTNNMIFSQLNEKLNEINKIFKTSFVFISNVLTYKNNSCQTSVKKRERSPVPENSITKNKSIKRQKR